VNPGLNASVLWLTCETEALDRRGRYEDLLQTRQSEERRPTNLNLCARLRELLLALV
jgi:hypothetical protein